MLKLIFYSTVFFRIKDYDEYTATDSPFSIGYLKKNSEYFENAIKYY